MVVWWRYIFGWIDDISVVGKIRLKPEQKENHTENENWTSQYAEEYQQHTNVQVTRDEIGANEACGDRSQDGMGRDNRADGEG